MRVVVLMCMNTNSERREATGVTQIRQPLHVSFHVTHMRENHTHENLVPTSLILRRCENMGEIHDITELHKRSTIDLPDC